MVGLPPDILELITIYLSEIDVVGYSGINTLTQDICDASWRRRAVTLQYIKTGEEIGDHLSPRERYLQLIATRGTIYVPGIEKYHHNLCHNPDSFFMYAAVASGDLRLVKHLFRNGNTQLFTAFYWALYKKHLSILYYLIDKIDTEDYLRYIHMTTKSGNLEILKLFINKYKITNFKRILDLAAANGRLNILRYVDSTYEKISSEDAEEMYIRACCTGNLNTVRYMIEEKGITDINKGIEYAGQREGGEDVVDYLLQKGADINISLRAAVLGRQIKVLDYLIDKGVPALDEIITFANKCGRMRIAEYLQNKVQTLQE